MDMKVNLAEAILNTAAQYKSDHDKLAGAVMNTRLGLNKSIAVELGKSISLGRDQFVQQLNEYLMVDISATSKIIRICNFDSDHQEIPTPTQM